MTDLLRETCAALASVVEELGEREAWTPTGCVGWTVHDLVWHLRADAVRGLVAAHTPAGRNADCDSVAYWRDWGSDPDADEQNRRMTRVEAGLHTTLHHLDLVAHLDAAPPPTPGGLAEVRRVVEELLGRRLAGWSDERVALVGTGRAEPTPDEVRDLGGARLPVFS